MVVVIYIIFGVYMLALCYVTIFCLMQFHLLYKYMSGDPLYPEEVQGQSEDIPIVTVQLPIFNEMYVVQRLIDNIMTLDYPKHRFEVQVLDDSTDETYHLCAAKVKEYQDLGFDICHIHRIDRQGFKAGALQEGLKVAKGEFIAIFDADFLPNSNFLKSTIPHFNHPEIGVVQTKWEHINQDYSLITELQAFQLNVHFTVEQTGRQKGSLFLQFNGTAGVWRKSTIVDAGGWQADTLTEDLDLSMRAQLRGWKIHYLEAVGSPAELPAEMNGLKSQQYRWMKGGAETARKILPALWQSKLSFFHKLHSTLHLLSSAVFVFVFILGVFSVPLLFYFDTLGFDADFLRYFLIGMASIVIVYYVGNVHSSWKGKSKPFMILKFIGLFPLFLALSMGLSFHNSIAVLQGYWGKKSPFVRTPKFNITGVKDSLKRKNYLAYRLNWTTIGEGILSLYFMVAFVMGIVSGNHVFLLFHLLLALGFGSIFYYTVNHLSLTK